MSMGSEGGARLHARLYTAENCSLCERAYPILERLAAEGLLSYERIDIHEEAALVERYGTRIPVLLLSSGEKFEGRISEYRLRKLLAARAGL